MTSLAAGRSLDAAAARAYGPYRRRVRANRRRLAFVYRNQIRKAASIKARRIKSCPVERLHSERGGRKAEQGMQSCNAFLQQC